MTENPNVRHIAIDTGDGVAVMLLVTDAAKPTEQSIAAELERAGFAGRPWARVNVEDIPTDRSTRANWRLKGGKIIVLGA